MLTTHCTAPEGPCEAADDGIHTQSVPATAVLHTQWQKRSQTRGSHMSQQVTWKWAMHSARMCTLIQSSNTEDMTAPTLWSQNQGHVSGLDALPGSTCHLAKAVIRHDRSCGVALGSERRLWYKKSCSHDLLGMMPNRHRPQAMLAKCCGAASRMAMRAACRKFDCKD